jgi:hypothetical protein
MRAKLRRSEFCYDATICADHASAHYHLGTDLQAAEVATMLDNHLGTDLQAAEVASIQYLLLKIYKSLFFKDSHAPERDSLRYVVKRDSSGIC